MIPERDVTDSVWSDASTGRHAAIRLGCAQHGGALTVRGGGTGGPLQVLGVWCPGCGRWVCEACRYTRHGEPVPTHAPVPEDW